MLPSQRHTLSPTITFDLVIAASEPPGCPGMEAGRRIPPPRAGWTGPAGSALGEAAFKGEQERCREPGTGR